MSASSSPTMLTQRIVAAIRGAFVADAASMGVHWIYDPDVMAKTVDSVEAPEFKEMPTPQFYSPEEFPGHYEKGMLSPFGEQLLFVTEYVASKKSIDGEDMSKAMFEWVKSFGGRPDHALIAFRENMEKSDGSGAWPNCGADDDQGTVDPCT
jgi:ADP-ribosylglycohydrolase